MINGVHGLWWMVLIGIGLLVVRMIVGNQYRGRSFKAGWFLSGGAFALIGGATVLALLFCTWPTKPMEVFKFGTPPWLGNQNLIVPSVIFWGFPWVGTVGVLIYLAGLQNISNDVYEAAELDGVGSVRKLFSIELPLIMTQVRINLIFLTIGTITDYGFFLLLLGQDGGPGAKGMVPGLYMFKSAFVDQKYGYACALGMILFVILLMITVLYQRFVKVEK
jgi:raffinose/stachyose/melibiose transport system permease protein